MGETWWNQWGIHAGFTAEWLGTDFYGWREQRAGETTVVLFLRVWHWRDHYQRLWMVVPLNKLFTETRLLCRNCSLLSRILSSVRGICVQSIPKRGEKKEPRKNQEPIFECSFLGNIFFSCVLQLPWEWSQRSQRSGSLSQQGRPPKLTVCCSHRPWQIGEDSFLGK